MKKVICLIALMSMTIFVGCNKYDEDIDNLSENIADMENKVQELAQQLLALQNWQEQVNNDIQSLKKIVDALEKRDYVISVQPLADGTGYTITFLNSGSVTIFHGMDGDSPNVSVTQDDNGDYYWTVDGEWLTDEYGNKIPATGEDGKDAVAPKVRINNTTNEWEISVDGYNWASTGVNATGPKGDKGDKGDVGATGSSGKDVFSGVDISNTDYVIFTLSNGTKITLPRYQTCKVQSLVYIPTHADGKATVVYDVATGKAEIVLDFLIAPRSLVDDIKMGHVKAKGVYTSTSRGLVLIDLPVLSISGNVECGTISITLSGEGLTDFLSGVSGASVFLIINDGYSEFISDYIQLSHSYIPEVETPDADIPDVDLPGDYEPGYAMISIEPIVWATIDGVLQDVTAESFITYNGDETFTYSKNEDGSVSAMTVEIVALYNWIDGMETKTMKATTRIDVPALSAGQVVMYTPTLTLLANAEDE